MTRITIGQTNTRALTLDVSALLEGGGFITASSGLGKSWLLRLLIERTIPHVQNIVIDPEGEFNTLRERFDMLLVGVGGEVAAEVRSARLLARKLAELKLSAVIDLYDLGTWDERRRYVAEFLSGLMAVPKSLYHPILVAVDEAHQFAPKSGGKSDEPAGLSLRAMNELASAGRKRGFRLVAASQRITKIHNDTIADLKTRFIGGATLDTDQQRAADELGFATKAERVALRDLDPGEFYAYGPAVGRGLHRFKSDKVATTHPKTGQHKLAAPPPTPDAIKQLAEALADLPAQAQEEADELASLKRRVVEQERQLRARPVQTVAEKVVERVEVPVLKDADVARLGEVAGQLASMATVLQGAATEVSGALRAFAARPAARMPLATQRPVTAAPVARPVAPARATADTDTTLRAGERKMLQALAQRHPLRYTRSQLGTLAGFAPRGGTFQTYFGTLKRAGYIVESGGEVEITIAGLDYLGADVPAAPTTTAEMLAMWRARLRAGEVKMLDVLVEAYPDGMSREMLGELSGFTHSGGTFQTYLGTLRRNGLVEVRGDVVGASETLFVGG